MAPRHDRSTTVAGAPGVSPADGVQRAQRPAPGAAGDRASGSRAAIDELGYRPTAAARRLRTRRSPLIGLRLEPDRDGINGAVLDRFLHALVDAGAGRAATASCSSPPPTTTPRSRTYDELLDAADVDALRAHRHPPRRPAHRAGSPSAACRSSRSAARGARSDQHHSWVDVDGAAGTRAATEHLLGLGHRRIGFIGWPAGSGVGDDRRDGWRAAMSRRPRLAAERRPAGARRRTASPRAARPPSALLAAPTRRPRWSARATRSPSAPCAAPRAGARAVIGFDDTPVARAVGLTSVGQPARRPAAARCLEQVLDGRSRGRRPRRRSRCCSPPTSHRPPVHHPRAGRPAGGDPRRAPMNRTHRTRATAGARRRRHASPCPACGGGAASTTPRAAARGEPTGPAALESSSARAATPRPTPSRSRGGRLGEGGGNTAEVVAAQDLNQQLGQGFAGRHPPDVFYVELRPVRRLRRQRLAASRTRTRWRTPTTSTRTCRTRSPSTASSTARRRTSPRSRWSSTPTPGPRRA